MSMRGAVLRTICARAWHLDEHREARMAPHERGDVSIVRSREEIAFPVSGYRSVLDLGWALADRDRVHDLAKPVLRCAALGLAHLPTGAKVRHQLLLQHPSRVNEEALVDRFLRELHR